MLFSAEIENLAQQVIERFAAQKKKIVTAESCTGGLLSGALTAIAGSSEVFERGFVTYSYDAKSDVLGVLFDDLAQRGAVSSEVAEAMAQGALDFSKADIAISVTGIAGPGGSSPQKPVGLVFFGIAQRDGVVFHARSQFKGDRHDVRGQAVAEALRLLLTFVQKEAP